MMRNQKTKNEKGITLIALIITIVVLLILAVVAIGAIDDSDIIAHAQNAASTYKQSEDNEISMLSKYEQKIESIIWKDKKYEGNGMTIVWKANNIVDIYQGGKLMFSNVQAKEIPIPEGTENPENYSKFFEIVIDGETIVGSLNKDGSVLSVGELTFNEVKEDKSKTYPRAYAISGDDLTIGVIVLSQWFDEAVMIIESGEQAAAVKGMVIDCNDIRSLNSEYRNFKIEDNAGVPYTKAIVSDSGQPSFLYFPSVDAWTMVGTYSESGKLVGFTINQPTMQYKSMTKEQINRYIELSNQQQAN